MMNDTIGNTTATPPKAAAFNLAAQYASLESLRSLRDDEIRQLRQTDPDVWTFAALARRYGMTRARACQICSTVDAAAPAADAAE